MRRGLRKYALFVADLCGLISERRLVWLIRFAQQRSRYRLKALHDGVEMNRNGLGDLFNLRRNIHRIEKGLLHDAPRVAFAEDYILETISYLAQIKSCYGAQDSTIAWSEAVLEQYFQACEHADRIGEAHKRYRELEPDNTQPVWCPYKAKTRPDLDVAYEALYHLAVRRRSVRHYLGKTVEFGSIDRAMRVAALSPSACNRQSFRFLFCNDKRSVREISQLPGGVSGYELPSIVVIIASYRGYSDERDADVPIVDASLAAMAFLLALETQGLASVCINWPALPDRDEAIRRLIRLEDDEFVVLLIGVGYPDPEGKIPYSAKRDTDCLILHTEALRLGS